MTNRQRIVSPAAEPLTIRTPSLERYTAAHGTLIPLHRWDDESNRGGRVQRDGKRPIHTDWTKRRYGSAKVLKRCVEQNRNVGVRLPADVVVIDIDPRNGGNEGWDAFCFEYGIDETIFPCVITGSGGRHYYARKPADVPVVDTLKDFPGVEFKSKGRQVVAAGSIHTNGEYYRWDEDAPRDMPMLPELALNAIRRPERAASAGGGELDPSQAADALARLNPGDFRQHDKWMRLMMAMHHATLGDARQEFVDWSISDPEYANDADMIGRRWDSLHTTKDGEAVTIGTLRHFLSEANALDVLPPDNEAAADDFADADDSDFDTSDSDDDDKPIRLSGVNAGNINGAFRLVNINGKVRIMYMGGKSSLDKSVRVPEIWLEDDFKRVLRNKFMIVESKAEDGEVKATRMPLASWWLAKKDRYTYDGLIFDSTHCESEEDEINLWRGFSVDQKPNGDWGRMRKHIRDIIANGDAASDSYIMKWLAWAVQNPTKHCEVAIVFLSEEKGTGKGFLGRAMCRVFGAHGLHISQRSHLVGKFNAHFMQCGLLFCDEVIWPGHKEDEGVLKALITEPTLTVEPKGVNAYSVLNALKLMLASNEKWVVPASGNERRYAVFEVSDKHKQDHGYFKSISEQLDNGGLGAMLHDLLQIDLEGWHPRQDIPQTEALARQKELTAEPQIKLMGDILDSGDLPGRHGKPNRARAGELYDHMRKRSKALDYWSDNMFAKFMEGMGAKRKRSNGTVWEFPPLQETRARFLEAHPWWSAFDSAVIDWESEFTEGDDE